MAKMNRRKFLTGSAAALTGASLAACTDSSDRTDLSAIGKTPHSKFAVNVEMWWSDLPFLERIEQVASLGFPAIELWGHEGKDLEQIKQTCDRHNLEITQFTAWGFNPGMNNPVNHDAFEETIGKACEVAKKLDCKLATVVGGDDQEGMTQEEMHEQIIVALKRVAPIAERNDLTLILEPMNIRVDHKGHSLYGSDSAVRICREVNSTHVKINWDFYHMHISEGDLCGHLREGFDQVGYLQLADHPGRNEPGTGEIHYPRVLKEAYDLGYRGYVGLECRPLGDPIEAAKRVAQADQW